MRLTGYKKLFASKPGPPSPQHGRTMSDAVAAGAATPAPWYAAFPEAQSSCPRVEASEVKKFLDDVLDGSSSKHRSILLVDVRQTDWVGGTIATSINLPSQTLYPTRPVIHQLCKQAGIHSIIFYCGEFKKKVDERSDRI